jgi:hypothetical protein
MIVKHFGSAKDFRSHSANFLHRAKSLHDHQRDPVTNEAQVKIVNENTSEKELNAQEKEPRTGKRSRQPKNG